MKDQATETRYAYLATWTDEQIVTAYRGTVDALDALAKISGLCDNLAYVGELLQALNDQRISRKIGPLY